MDKARVLLALLVIAPLASAAEARVAAPPWLVPPRALAQDVDVSSGDVEVASGEEDPPWVNRGPWAYITLGAAGATALAGVLAGFHVRTVSSKWATATTDAEWASARDDAHSAATTATVVWISSGVLTLAAGGLFFFTRF